ncbi:hypothetical protein FHS57_005156 [Runella defluvii]|uniref:Uncharacterized protein n=1 Tax=Runella defluvii TaxID=370973 RepID=A0A7W5ZQX3_9BACT|nr:hypothetical protein [Runella defluvii]MBB3841135.1 hypothetical protein [Runella defluvii]
MKAKFLIFCLMFIGYTSYSQQTKSQTEAQIDTLLPTNNTRQITALKIRQALKSVVNYASPSNLVAGSILLSKIAQSGAITNQVPRWNGSSWVPQSIDSDSVSLSRLSQGNASLNQVLKWDGSSWIAANDLVGTSSGGGATWGTIPGTLSDQTDLQLAFNAKLNSADTTNLLRKTTAASLYQPKGNYLTTSVAASTYQPIGSYLTGITSGQVTTALGFTPYNATNPSGFITSSAITGKLNIADTTDLLRKTTAASLYQPKGSYLTTSVAASTYQPIGSYLTGITSGQVTTALGFTPYNATNPSGFITSSAITGKLNIADTTDLLRKTTAASLYQPKGNYLTGITSGQVTTALGFTPYNATNPSGFITSSAITGKLNIADTTDLLRKTTAASLYQPKGSYLTTSVAASTYQPIGSYLTGITSGQVTTALGFTPYNATNPSGFITASAITGKLNIADTTDLLRKTTAASLYQPKGSYLTTSVAASTYQPIGSYLTGITSGQVTTALGFTPYNATNPSGFITASALSPYLTSATAASTYQPIGSYQNSLQYRDEGINVGTAGGISTVNFTGAGVVASVSGSALTADVKDFESLVIAASDETTSIGAGMAKVTFRMPYAMTVTNVRISVNTAQVSGALLTVVIKENGTSILSTNLTLDNTEKSSTTAATPAVISDSILGDDSEITIDVSQIGDGTAKGLKVIFNGYRN